MTTELEREALLAIDQLEARVRELEYERAEPIAIIGMACRYPGCNDPVQLWQLLASGGDAFEPRDGQEPGGPGRPGRIDALDRFDAAFFRISPREAQRMDPRQRLLLEASWEALEDAGLSPLGLAAAEVGVYVGVSGNGHAPMLLDHEPDIYNVTGTVAGVSAGRISFVLGLRGPSLALDTTCSSSLVAVHLGCQALRARDCELAVVGGVGVMPRAAREQSWWAELGHLSKTGRCRSFDASGDGIVGSDGCGMIVLKRLGAAQRDGDRIAAVIRGTAINHDGVSQGLTVPSGVAQEDVIRRALGDAGLSPRDIDYVECHGTGTALGDPIEIEALGQVVRGRALDQPILVGSIKSNLGHTDAAAGVTGLLKVVLALRHERIPKTLHFTAPNPHIPWSALPIRVAAEAVAWPRGYRPRRAGVSSFGLSGTNAHVVVEEAPAAPIEAPAAPPRGAELIVLSAGSEAALAEVARRLRERLIASAMPATEEISHLGDLACSLATRRPHHEHRVAVTATTLDELASALDAIGRGETPRGAAHGQVGAARGQLAWLFTGQGAQRLGMGRGLYASWPVFRDALDAAFAAFAAASPALAQLRDVMWAANDDAGAKRLEQTGWTQPALFAVEWALAALWRSWGIEPDVVCGHSIGELAAAAVAGVVSLDDAARLVAARGQLMQALPAGGAMVAVDGAEADVRAVLADRPAAGHVSLAAINGPASVVLSGALDALTALAGVLGQRGMRTRRLAVSHAFHSDLMAPMLDEFGRVAAQVRFHKPWVPLISNLTGELAGDEITTADYWVRHIREAVRFGDSMGALHARGVDSYVEIGPRPTLVGLVAACLPPGAREPALIASLRPELADEVAVLSALGRCHTQGRPIAWSAVFPTGGRRVELPTYPWQRERHWIDPVPQRVHGKATGHPLLGTRIAAAGVDAAYETSLSTTAYPWLADHRIGERVIVPGTAIAELVRAAAEHYLEDAPEVKRLVLQAPLVLDGDKPRRVQVVITESRAQVYSLPADASAWTLHAAAEIAPRAPTPRPAIDLAAIRARCTTPVDVSAMYDGFAATGLHYGPVFRGVAALAAGTHEALGELHLPTAADARGYGGHPALLDAAVQVLRGAVPADNAVAWVPFELGRVVIYEPGTRDVFAHARLADGGTADAAVVDITLMDGAGTLIAELSSVRFRRIDRLWASTGASNAADPLMRQLAWQLAWSPAAVPATSAFPGRWLVVSDDEAAAAPLVAALRASRVPYALAAADAVATALPADHVVCVWPGSTTVPDDERAVQLVTAGLAVVQAVVRQSPPPRLWWLTVGAVDAGDAASACPAAAAVWGLGRTVMHERPELRCTLIDLDGFDRAANALARELAATDDEPQVAWRAGSPCGDRFVARLVRGRAEARVPTEYELVARDKGTLDSLALIPAARRAPGPGEVELEVRASGINFRDVLNALGTYPGEAGALGNECAGVVVAIGPGVTSVACGDAVMGFAPGGAFRRHVTVDARHVAAIPRGLSFAQAATVPLVFLTAWYALHDLGKLQPGERLVVHAAAGGVGMAAVQIGRWRGARVLATASRAKWDAVRALGVTDIASSRDVSFAGAFRSAAGGADVVLNALTGEIVDASLSLLGPGGRFLEMGKLGLRSPDEVAAAHPGVRYRAFDLMDAGPDRIAEMLGELIRGFEAGVLQPLPVRSFPITQAEHAFRFMAQARHIGKLALLPVSAPRTGSVLITGGLGGLGSQVARWLATRGCRELVLTGRRGLDAPGARDTVAAIEALGARVTVAAIDVADRAALARLLDAIPPDRPLRGIIHAAGVLDDGMLHEQTAERCARVLAPKVCGATHLDALTRGLDLEFFVLFSSVAATLGSAAQGTYAAANAFLDALAVRRRADGQPATSVAWGPWDGAGMAGSLDPMLKQRLARSGVRALAPDDALAVLGELLGRDDATAVIARFDLTAIERAFAGSVPALWRRVVAPAQPTQPGQPRLAAASVWLSELRALPAAARLPAILAVVRSEAARVLSLAGPDAVPLDTPFKEIGLDSLMSVELRNALNKRARTTLPATLAFDHPTAQALAAHLLATLFDDAAAGPATTPPAALAAAPSPVASVTSAGSPVEPIAIVGIGCRYPGGVHDAESFWRLLDDGTDAITEVPRDRWNVDAYYDADPEAPDKMYTRRAGFLDNIDQFDARFFGISAREAASMDPQQRLLLEVTWEAFANANQPVEALRGAPVGVFVGICSNDYGDVIRSSGPSDSFSATGNAMSVAAGRLSYAFGFEGPAMSLDTACSSSLVAVHLACQHLRSSECDLAVAAGANLILSPAITVAFCRLRALSPRGTCSAFDADADGYVRAEGCAAIVLKRLVDAERAGDRILGVIRGSAVNHDGRSNGLTAPSGRAQEAVIRRALHQAGLRPADLGYIEAHGTGTRLGDAIELQALGAVVGADRGGEPLVVGSVKTNIGHTEAAAGLAGLIKVVLSLSHGVIPRSLHFATPSPHVPWAELPVRIAREPIAWPVAGEQRFAGVSSFGISGTNAHVVVSTPPPAALAAPAEPQLVVIPLSAKTPTALLELATSYDRFLARTAAASIAEVAHAAAVGRHHFRERAAVIAASRDDAHRELAALAAGKIGRSSVRGRGSAGPPPGLVLVVPAQICSRAVTEYAWPALAKAPAFEAALRDCEAASQAVLGTSLAALLGDAAGPRERAAVQFAIGYALAATWRAWGIASEDVHGDGAGAAVAAALAGTALAEALRLALDDVCAPPAVAVEPDPLASRVVPRLVRGVAAVIVLGPLSAVPAIEAACKQVGISCLPSLAALPGDDDAVMLRSLAALYALGAQIDWRAVYSHRAPRIALPPYPWQRIRYWPTAASAPSAATHSPPIARAE